MFRLKPNLTLKCYGCVGRYDFMTMRSQHLAIHEYYIFILLIAQYFLMNLFIDKCIFVWLDICTNFFLSLSLSPSFSYIAAIFVSKILYPLFSSSIFRNSQSKQQLAIQLCIAQQIIRKHITHSDQKATRRRRSNRSRQRGLFMFTEKRITW